MSTFGEMIYMVMDEIKLNTDDSYYTEDHVLFMLSKYRALLLNQRYTDAKREVPDSNYQTIKMNLVCTDNIFDKFKDCMKKSKEEIPKTLEVGITQIRPGDNSFRKFNYVSKERFEYVGSCYNKYTNKLIYTTIMEDDYLYITSQNPQFKYIDKVNIHALFEDIIKASELEEPFICELQERRFPIEEGLVSPLIELVVKDLLSATYRPKDDDNNAKDDTSDLNTFIARNMKSQFAKQLEG